MVSKAKRQAAIEYARQELSVFLHSVAKMEQVFSVHHQQVTENIRIFDELPDLAISLDDEDAPRRIYLRLLIEDASRDPAAFESLGLLAARAIDAGDPIPDELRKFAVDVLRGQIQSPIARGAPPVHPARNEQVSAAADEARSPRSVCGGRVMPRSPHWQKSGAFCPAPPAPVAPPGCLGSSPKPDVCGGQRPANTLVSKENSGFAGEFAPLGAQGAHPTSEHVGRGTDVEIFRCCACCAADPFGNGASP